MKRISVILMGTFLFLTGCKDGDLTIQSISFEDTQVHSCTNNITTDFLYKVQGNQALILMFNKGTLVQEEGTITGALPTNFRLLYRSFNNTPSANYFCTTPPSSTPLVLSEIEAKGGEVQIVTKKVIDTTTNVVKFNHLISIKNLVIQNSEGEKLIDSDFIFGSYQTTQVN